MALLVHESESEVAQSRPTLSDPMDCSLPGSSIHGIFQARVLEWDAIAFSHFFLVLNNIPLLGCIKVWDFQVVLVVKKPPANAGEPGLTLGGEDTLQEGMATHFSILAWRIPWTRSLVGYSPWDHKESDRTEGLSTYTCTSASEVDEWLGR